MKFHNLDRKNLIKYCWWKYSKILIGLYSDGYDDTRMKLSGKFYYNKVSLFFILDWYFSDVELLLSSHMFAWNRIESKWPFTNELQLKTMDNINKNDCETGKPTSACVSHRHSVRKRLPIWQKNTIIQISLCNSFSSSFLWNSRN